MRLVALREGVSPLEGLEIAARPSYDLMAAGSTTVGIAVGAKQRPEGGRGGRKEEGEGGGGRRR